MTPRLSSNSNVMAYPGLFNSSYVASPQEIIFIHTPQNQLGPPLIGQILVTLLQGTLFVQYYEYLLAYWNEKRWTKWLVHLTFCLCVLKFAYVWWFSWDRFVTHFGNWAYLAIFSPISVPIGISSTIPSAVCQTFYIYRCWVLSRNYYFVIPAAVSLFVTIGSGIALTWGSGLAAGGKVVASNLILISINISLASGLLCDIFITTFTCYYLIREKTGFRETDGLVERLVRGTLESVAGPTIVNLINLILSNFSVNNQWFLVPNLALSHVYACSLLYSVNARKGIGLRTTIMSSNPPVCRNTRNALPAPSISQIVASIFRVRTGQETVSRSYPIDLNQPMSQGSSFSGLIGVQNTITGEEFLEEQKSTKDSGSTGSFRDKVPVQSSSTVLGSAIQFEP